MFSYFISVILIIPHLVIAAYQIEPLPMQGRFDDLLAASPSGHLVVQEKVNEPKRQGLRTYLYAPGASPILIEPDKKVEIFSAAVNSEGFVAGCYRRKGDPEDAVKVFISIAAPINLSIFPSPFLKTG